jgi:U32 family peptidase
VQANAVNWASVEFWRRQGLTRAILSRELSLEEIAEIRREGAGHGAGGVRSRRAVHGLFRALPAVRLHQQRDANQGACTNACRWEYKTRGARNEVGEIVPL